MMGGKMGCEVILPRNKLKGEHTDIFFTEFCLFIFIGSSASCNQKFHLNDRYCGRVVNTADMQTQNIQICGNYNNFFIYKMC